jgi:crossover junction endodeoxyribonuclease RuvC
VRILGIDPGSRITGYGVIDVSGQRLVHVDSGCLRVTGDDLGQRLHQIHRGIAEVVARHDPAELAIEKVFVHRNVGSALKLGQARGAAVVAAVAAGLTMNEYSPNEIKQAVTGRGHAQKQQVQHMIKMLLALPELPASDAADALAVAVCHGHVRDSRARLARAAGAAR